MHCGPHGRLTAALGMILYSGIVSASLWVHDARFDDMLPAAVDAGLATQTVPVSFSMLACARLCGEDNACSGFFYDENTKRCLLTSAVYLRQGSDVASPGFQHYRTNPLACPADGLYALHEPSRTCFHFIGDKFLTWPDARDACDLALGRLAVLDTWEKEAFLIEFTRLAAADNNTFAGFYHVGAHRPYAQWNSTWPDGMQDFVWLSGQSMVLHVDHWMAGQPNNLYENDNTVTLRSYAREEVGSNVTALEWVLADAMGTVKLRYICEFSLF